MNVIMSSLQQKRIRGPNYNTSEKTTLLELVATHKDIIENKKTNKKTTIQKQNAWAQIENDFNALIVETPKRTKEQLKQLYESLKHFAKKENSAIKVSCTMIEKKYSGQKLALFCKM